MEIIACFILILAAQLFLEREVTHEESLKILDKMKYSFDHPLIQDAEVVTIEEEYAEEHANQD